MSFADDLRSESTNNSANSKTDAAEGIADIYLAAIKSLCKEAAQSGKHSIRGYVDVRNIDGLSEGFICDEITVGTFAFGGTKHTLCTSLINGSGYGFGDSYSEAEYERIAKDVCKKLSQSLSTLGFSKCEVKHEVHPEITGITGGFLGKGKKTGRRLNFIWILIEW